VRIPVSVVHGAKAGPVLALIAGTHGVEYTSVVARRERWTGWGGATRPAAAGLGWPQPEPGLPGARRGHGQRPIALVRDPAGRTASNAPRRRRRVAATARWDERERRGGDKAPRVRFFPHHGQPLSEDMQSSRPTPRSRAASPRSPSSRAAWASRTRRPWRLRKPVRSASFACLASRRTRRP
jgi:hypothetical protein